MNGPQTTSPHAITATDSEALRMRVVAAALTEAGPVALDVLESLARRGLLTLIEEPVAPGGGS